MKSIAKQFALAALTAITVAAPIAVEAQAHDWKRYSGQRYLNYREYSDQSQHYNGPRVIRRQHYRSYDDALALGILGLATGAIIGGAIASQPAPVYRARPGRVIHYGGSLEPWSRSWYNYCNQRYRSFNPRTGTFRGYDGRNHFCVAR